MIQLSGISNNILNTAGDLSKSNAATTMITTGLGLVRAGMVPLDKKTPAEEKSQVMTWMIVATGLSLLTQMSVYKMLNGVVNGINTNILQLGKNAKQFIGLEKLPLDNIDDALRNAGKDANHWKVLKKTLLTTFDPKNPGEKETLKSLFKNLNQFAKANGGSVKELSKDKIDDLLMKVRTMKGSKQFFMYAFGAALFTGYIIPTFICKYLPNMLNFLHEKVRIKDKPIVPKPKEKPGERKQKSNFNLFGIPLLASGGALAFLRYVSPESGIGKAIQNGFKKVASWDYGLSTNARIVRNIFTNAILRPAAALLDGRIFLAAYNFVIETLSAGSLIASKKVLGSASAKGSNNVKGATGLIGKAIKKLNITDIKKAKGIEFMMTHSIQTFLILGVVLGLTTNVFSRHLTNFLKNKVGIKEGNDEVPPEKFFPASVSLQGIRGDTEYTILSPQFKDFLSRTGYIKTPNQNDRTDRSNSLTKNKKYSFHN
jgi:hypothetical protein